MENGTGMSKGREAVLATVDNRERATVPGPGSRRRGIGSAIIRALE